MERGLFLVGLLIALIAVYRMVWRQVRSPQTTVRGLLRRYHAFEKMGLPAPECLFRVLSHRIGWKHLPPKFLAEIVARLESKENVFRFVSLAEGYQFNRKQMRTIAAGKNMEVAMREVALWLVDFGSRLQRENSLKEAEFVQKLAVGLQPDQYFTKLPLAMTYYKMERHDQAAPLFEEGLAALQRSDDGAVFLDRVEPGASRKEVRATYQKMYAACLKAGENQQSSETCP